ncbi:sulfurtransferase [Pontibacillus halophilus JSM 076056 = DSM 19796]|uniref:Sulfurtransferase n=1 Tax=Pontibacillus halophilus JSM 076056 = DSM 19796 TaxID=1385510 RepID=A0A0A5GDL4_9BACI|nr:rhodanese-like domain-containing protein [Pontibacillus halophilus]KGX89303.1 sulfurtransferase [Pontibacillus halophilus JSM 076056 = DSM 19796]
MEYVSYVIYGILIYLIVKRFLPVKGMKQITTTQLKEQLNDKDKQYVDVRTAGEFKRNSIRGFKNIPLQTLDKKATQQLDSNKEVVVICQSGMRSKQASKVLKRLGFTSVTNVKGGMNTWRP